MCRDKSSVLFKLNLLIIGLLFVLLPSLGAQDIDSLASIMTNHQKIGQMILVYHSPYKFLREHEIGGVLIMANMLDNPRKLAKELRKIRRKMPIAPFVTIDQEGGKVNRLKSISRWKHLASAREMSTWPADSIEQYVEKIAKYLKKLGANINLAPVLDPTHDWQGNESFMSVRERSFGKSADEICPPARAFVKGFARQGIQCISKHFPGYDVATNSDHDIAVSTADSAAVAAYTRPFVEVNGAVAGVLMSSIHYAAFCEKPSVFSPRIVGWARRLAEERIIMTDDLWGTALRSYITPGVEIKPAEYPDSAFCRLVEAAFWAGNDVLMITYPIKVVLIHQTLANLAARNPAAQLRIDESVRRILAVKKKMGIL